MKEGWEVKKLGEVCTINPPKKEALSRLTSDDMVSFLPMEDLDIKAYYTEPKQHRSFSEVQSSYTYFTNGDVLLAKVTPCFENGKIGIAHNLVNGIGFGSSEFLVFRLKESILKEYLYYNLQNKTFVKEAIKNLTGSSGLRRVPKTFVENYKIPLPPLPEQEKIVAELDCLSGIIEKKKQQLKELDTLAQSIFYEMFGDPVENEKGWEVKKLGEVCSLKAGKSIKASELSPSLSDGLYPCFGGNGIRGYIAKVSHRGTFPIIGRQGALCGNVVMSTEEFYATEHAVVVQPLVDMNVSWLYSTLKFMNLNKLAQGVAQPGLSVGRVSEEYIPLPPLSLQHSFASKIEAIEKQKTLIKQSIAETETLFNSRMQEYFN